MRTIAKVKWMNFFVTKVSKKYLNNFIQKDMS